MVLLVNNLILRAVALVLILQTTLALNDPVGVKRSLQTSCVDSELRFITLDDSTGNNINQFCNWVARKNTDARCSIPGISTHCPDTCGTCGNCVDSTVRFRIIWKEELASRGCGWFERKPNRCSKVDGARDTCRLSCGTCSVTDVPTKVPTTKAPTKAPTTKVPTKAPTTSVAPTKPGATKTPTKAPITSAPTKATTTVAPTKAPTTAAPTSTVAPTLPCEDSIGAVLCAEWAECCVPDFDSMSKWCAKTCGLC